MEQASEADVDAVTRQLQRPPRGLAAIAWRCPCGSPGVVATAPRLPDGSPFPTTYYLTCPNAVAGCSRLEASGLMTELTAALTADDDLAGRYRAAHRAYLADRQTLGDVAEIADVSAGGMPDRVKCLHALLGHALAAGPGVNPVGDLVRERLGDFWRTPCLAGDAGSDDDGGNR